MLSVDVKRLGERNFKEFIKVQPAIGNLIVNAIAEKYAGYVRQRYLTGQVLTPRTGETWWSTRFFKIGTGAFGVRPGVGVRGRLNYLLRFERGDRPFMKPSFEAFRRTREPEKISVRIYNAMERKILSKG